MASAFSRWFKIACGVPQSAALRPLLFLICENKYLPGLESHLNMFADDSERMGEMKIDDCDSLERHHDRLRHRYRVDEINSNETESDEGLHSKMRPASDTGRQE